MAPKGKKTGIHGFGRVAGRTASVPMKTASNKYKKTGVQTLGGVKADSWDRKNGKGKATAPGADDPDYDPDIAAVRDSRFIARDVASEDEDQEDEEEKADLQGKGENPLGDGKMEEDKEDMASDQGDTFEKDEHGNEVRVTKKVKKVSDEEILANVGQDSTRGTAMGKMMFTLKRGHFDHKDTRDGVEPKDIVDWGKLKGCRYALEPHSDGDIEYVGDKLYRDARGVIFAKDPPKKEPPPTKEMAREMAKKKAMEDAKAKAAGITKPPPPPPKPELIVRELADRDELKRRCARIRQKKAKLDEEAVVAEQEATASAMPAGGDGEVETEAGMKGNSVSEWLQKTYGGAVQNESLVQPKREGEGSVKSEEQGEVEQEEAFPA
ncbi:uncharacterized protein LTR77_004268 [Saxophila tyrrhenica]|uniref:Uncharacterized protein n=1 Tax=Saxophila tyrrhenica TaxID=1690608 RepID=A0AAV9PC66_9PEZI|nr:hypothetical protein LTR77_004268 [Saxophila tyrrhenica]